MRRPPAVAVEETPEKELPCAHVQPVEPATGDPQRDDAVPLADDLGDAQAVPERLRERRGEAETNEQAERDEIERTPVIGCDTVENELVARRNLVEPRQRNPCVRSEMHRVPRLVAQ